MSAAYLCAAGEIAVWGNANPGFTLHRFENECRGVRRNCSLERVRIAKRHDLDAGHEWPETLAILLFGRERNESERATMKIAFAGNNLCITFFDTFDRIGPLARGLERSL